MLNQALKCFGTGAKLYHKLVDKTPDIIPDDLIFAEWTLFNKEYVKTFANLIGTIGMKTAFIMSTNLEDKLLESKLALSQESKKNIANAIRRSLDELATHVIEYFGDEEFDVEEARIPALNELIILYLVERI